jgi:RNA 3'-terminal phosphate cyclase (ATP)
VEIGAAGTFAPLILEERGARISQMAEVVNANLPITIAERELAAVGGLMGWPAEQMFIRARPDAIGTGNCVLLTITYEHVADVATAFGRIGASSEVVAGEAVKEAQGYLASDAPVSCHLADQLILPMTLAAGGRYVTAAPSLHTRTNIEVIGMFLGRPATLAETGAGRWQIEVPARD